MLIFARNPELGRVKSRLAKQTSQAYALSAYQRMLAHTLAVVRSVAAKKYIYYSEYLPDTCAFQEADFQAELQTGGDLGERLQNALAQVFQRNGGPLLVLGSDCLELTARHLEEAFVSLQNHALVLGPSLDGGYYLLGLTRRQNELFQGVPWSTDQVLQTTLERAKALGLRWTLGETLRDVDAVDDLPESFA